MGTKLVGAAVCVCLCLVETTVSLRAHHAFAAEFDANKPISFKGTLTRMEWTNPHVWHWACEAGSPNALFRRGFTKKSMLPGTELLVDGYQAKDGSKRANGRDVTFADGRKMFLGSSGTGAPYELTPDKDRVSPER